MIVASPYTSSQREHLERLFAPSEVCFLRPQVIRKSIDALRDTDALIYKGAPDERFLQLENLKWVHCNQSGLERAASAELLASDLLITSAAGRSAGALAEHAIYLALALVYRAPDFARAQRRRVWGLEGQKQMRGLVGRRALIIGLGHTASALVPRCQALGMDVTVFRRRELPSDQNVPIHSLEAGDRLVDLLADADIVFLAASLNDSSYRMLGAAELNAMPQGSLLVNVARAQLTDTVALKRSLRNGTLAGAGLDVTEPEPLPPWDSLWSMRNVVLTPHVTPQVPDRPGAEIDIIAENFKRYRQGLPMINQLEARDLYSRAEAISESSVLNRLATTWHRLFRWRLR